MSASHARAAGAKNTDGDERSKETDDDRLTAKIPFAKFFRALRLGCPCGCGSFHECGVGEPLPDLPPPGVLERAGRDLDWQQRETVGRNWLAQGRGGR